MKYLFLLISLSSLLFSSNIEQSLLKIHATLVPKLLLMDYNFKEKTINNTINIVIAYDEIDYKYVKKLRKDIEHKYPNGLKSYKINIIPIKYSKLGKIDSNINLYYLFPSKKENIYKLIENANKKQALTFSYQNNDLSYGVMSSVYIGSKVKPLLNLIALKANDITLRPVLLKISKIYTAQGVN